MRARTPLGRIAALAVRRPWIAIAVCVAVAAAATVTALRLPTDAGTETLVDSGDPTFEATERFAEEFGDDAVVVLVRGPLQELVLTENLGRLLELEGCLAGGTAISAELPRDRERGPLPAACDEIAELAPSRVVFGPATFLYEAVAQIGRVLQGEIRSTQEEARRAGARARRQAAEQGLSEAEQDAAARSAREAVLEEFQSEIIQLALRYQLTGPPRLDDPAFVARVVFDPEQPAGTPKARFAYLFPNAEAALISVRLRPELSDAERHRAIELIREATGSDRFALREGSYVVSGVPTVVDGLAETLRTEILLLLGVAVLVMALVLFAMTAPPMRLLPLAVALAASGLAFGLLSALGGSLTMASIAVLPILIGLGVDYSIQFQARFGEARQRGVPAREAAIEAGEKGGPAIGAAVVATAAGLAAVALSPVPMVRSFALLLVAGVALAFAIALTGGLAALALAGRPRRPRRPRVSAPLRRAGERLALARARAGARIGRAGTSALAVAIAMPGRILGAGLVLAACGWIAGTQTAVVSDIRDLAPAGLPALRDADELQRQAGVAGELNVRVRSDDVAAPEVVDWTRDFQVRVLERHGFAEGSPGCGDARVCPAVSLTDLFGTGAGTGADPRELIELLPPYFSQAVVTRTADGGVGDTANIAFGIPVMPLDEQREVIEDIRAQVDPPGAPGPPQGTEVDVVGLPVLAAEANERLSASRYWLPLAGLTAVALALIAVYRSPRRALVPLVPIAMATGWSALLVAAIDVPLNPMSATLGALVIAIATEFSVILSARYEDERREGATVGEALRRTYARTGAAVLASGTTAIAGFAALAATDIRMLRDFGLVTVANLGVAVIGVLLVLPAALVWAERGAPLVRRRPAEGASPAQPAGGLRSS